MGEHGRLSIKLLAQTTNVFITKVYNTTADGMGTPVRQLQGSETFGYVDSLNDYFCFANEQSQPQHGILVAIVCSVL